MANEANISEQDILKLKLRLEKIEPLCGEFDSIQSDIDISAEGELELQQTQDNERFTFENNYFDSVALAKHLISKYDNSNSSNIPDNDNINLSSLPPMHLKTFSGNYEDWIEFRDTYIAMIHSNKKLDDMKKYYYLKGSLEGSAAQVIKEIKFGASYYNSAWNSLCERYDRAKMLIHKHVKALFNIETISKETSHKIRALVDEVSNHLQALENLNKSTDNWDLLLIHMITSKFDNNILRDWEKHTKEMQDETWSDLKRFLRDRADYLEKIEGKIEKQPSIQEKSGKFDAKQRSKGYARSFTSTSEFNGTSKGCVFCKGDHSIYSCEQFLRLSIFERRNFVNKAKLCLNCLRTGHIRSKCKLGPCRKCKQWHNTLIHEEISSNKHENNETIANNNTSLTTITALPSVQQTILSTACVKIADSRGKYHIARALLDSGSQKSFITERFFNLLGFQGQATNLSITGISNQTSCSSRKCNICIESQYHYFKADVTFFILKEITSNLPATFVDNETLNIPSNIFLADSKFLESRPIDILIGADLFWQLLCPNQIKINQYVFQETHLGWVASGQVGLSSLNNIRCHLSTSINLDLQMQLAKFWELEECQSTKILSTEEQFCEEHFKENTRRNENGRFIVRLPLKQSPESLGESKVQAEQRFYSLERKLKRNPSFRELYVHFMQEYQELNHMTAIEENDYPHPVYYMPHHGVLREQSLTTKLRVVFDCSAPTTSGLSLNHIQCVGPTLQDDLFSILIRFRQHRYVVTADIEKMYRMITVDDECKNLQRILWRDDPSEPIKTFVLNTVTYGQACASYLAIRCLIQLATDNEKTFPEIAEIILRDFYVDDMLTGADTIEETQHICQTVSNILKAGCFNLRKWYSNDNKVLDGLQHSNDACILKFDPEEKAKTLGLTWSCNADLLHFEVETLPINKIPTKRSVLSSISKIFDPLGLLGPCTVLAKTIMQKLWLEKISWDAPIPNDLAERWIKFQSELAQLSQVNLPRHAICKNYKYIEIHGFADSSSIAYGACIYLRSLDHDNQVHIHLLCSKSKVAPIKTISIPRLELCGALLLARLFNKVKQSLRITINETILWSDSTIVLSWIRTSPNLLNTFVSNRVSEIQSLTSNCKWRHVSSRDNPCDILSRGLFPSHILNHEIWWSGPPWLQLNESSWPTSKFDYILDLPELKQQNFTHLATASKLFPFERFSRLSHLKRVVAVCFRFKSNSLRSDKEKRSLNKFPISIGELDQAFHSLIRMSQKESFSNEIELLTNNKSIIKGKLASLNPFLDDKGLLRVGGRLINSSYEFNKIHPIVLDSKHKFCQLLFQFEHYRLMHLGPQGLLATIREQFWPIGGRRLARSTVKSCLTCFRFNPKTIQPMMGNLPKERLNLSSPFSYTGVDYAGPFNIKTHKGRGGSIIKGYISLFICFTTKAVHMELVSSLSANEFLLALRRFVARRGKPIKIFSDNGTNFVGAFKELGTFLSNNELTLQKAYTQEAISWHFNPPYSPHMGGIWEAGVKSCKHHLKRVLQNTHFTFEEFNTMLNQIEAILNSRPLCPLSSDPSDYTPLTPAHFLIGRPLVACPDRNITEERVNRLTRYQHIQLLCQHFWRRWSLEYIAELQHRTKWKTNHGSLSEGSLVLLKSDNTLPTQWRLGRIVHIFKGSDNVARVASIKTQDGIVKRSFTKICPLPIES
ncbi:uncharacterized protein [Diabrotica undecimpunctata]|uniref:uncharacterized protein n=1 Tax=Diabrotica undecimpunctata TaxID=50387 RepID=UPI003B6348B3